MAVLTKIATGAAVAAGSPFNGSWTNEQLARVAASDALAAGSNTYATCAPGKNQEFASLWPFVFSEIGANDTINSVTVTVQWKCSTTGSIGTLRSTLFADTGAGAPDQAALLSASPGVQSATPEPTADTTQSYTATCTAAQLRQGVWARAQALRGNTNTAYTASLDYIQIAVDYTAVVVVDLTATGITTGAPTVGTPAITQEHALTATGVDAGAPVLGAPALAEAAGTDALTATGITTGSPTLGAPAFGQEHAFTATGVSAGAPTLGAPALAEAAGTDALEATGFATGAPTLAAPAFGQVHVLQAAECECGAPELGAPGLAIAGAVASLPDTPRFTPILTPRGVRDSADKSDRETFDMLNHLSAVEESLESIERFIDEVEAAGDVYVRPWRLEESRPAARRRRGR